MSDESTQKNNGEGAPEAGEPARKVSRGKKRNVRAVAVGTVYIHASYNNTIATATDKNGDVLAWSSAGHMGFKGPKKSTPYAATTVIRDLAGKTKDYGLRDVTVFVKGIGSGRDAAVRALNAQGYTVLSIKDVTPIPHNGCRAPRPRRI